MECLELFAGAGGLALGLEKAGFKHIGLNEIDKFACETLKKNRPNWNIIKEDINDLADKDLEFLFGMKKGNLDLISGGHPCQAFSYSGKKLGLEDIRGTLFYAFARILQKLQPKMFLFENVKGLISHDKGRTLQTIVDVFIETGYYVQYKVLNANDYGVAQKRQRLIMIGVRSDLTHKIDYEYPIPFKYKPVLKDILSNCPPSEGQKYPESKKKVFELVPQGGYWRDLPDEIAREYMKTCYFMGGGRTGIARRLSLDEPCLTLLCSPQMKQTDRCHPTETRPFNIRESARIQSFPDEWEFTGNLTQQYKQIGNAVPVKLAEAIGISIIEALEGNKIFNLKFIKENDFKRHITSTIATYNEQLKSIDLKKFNSSIIDPIKLLFDKKVYKKEWEQLIIEEIQRQRDKSNTNAIGYFHQNMFKYIANCEIPEKGFDIIVSKPDKKIFVEMKNKHNTMNAASSKNTYLQMQNQILKDLSCECYLVEAIAKHSQNVTWKCTINDEKISNDRIRRVSIDKFYEIVTGNKEAFFQICRALPEMIDKIISENDDFKIQKDTVIQELKVKNPDILKSIYLLAFAEYEGFNNL